MLIKLAMQLSEWLKSSKTSQAVLAQRLGLTQGRVSQIVADGTDSLSTAIMIEEVTGGEVTVRELIRAAPSTTPAPQKLAS